MADDGPEPGGVPGDPVRHVATEGPAHHGGPPGVQVRAGEGGVGDVHQVGEGQATPRTVTAGQELLPVARGQARIGQQDRVAPGRHQPRVPPPGPGVPARIRAPVHPQQQRRGPVRGRGAGQHQPGPQRGSVGRGGLDLLEPARQRRPGSRAGEELGLAGPGRIEPHHERRAVHRRAQGVEELPVRRGAQAGVGAVIGGEPGDGPGVQVGAQHRAPAVVRGRDEDPRAVRGPGQLRGPVLQPGEQVQGFRSGPGRPIAG